MGELLFAALDLIYPTKCVVCGAFQDRYLCDDCRGQIEEIGDQICDICGAPCLERVCSRCATEPPSFKMARTVGSYEGTLRDAIHELKYQSKLPVVGELAQLMISFAGSHQRLMKNVELVIPIPIHYTRERRRGFNQAEALAAPLAAALGLPMPHNVLVRTRPTKSQVDLEGEERRLNVLDAFGVTRPKLVSGRVVLLVDDVLTTGSTADSAAQALLNAGAIEVRVLTLAR